MSRPKFTLFSDSEESDRSSACSDAGTESTFNQPLQQKLDQIRKRKRQEAEEITDEASAEEEVNQDSEQSLEDESESQGEQTTKRFIIKTRQQPKRKTVEEEDNPVEEETTKRRNVQLPKSKGKKAVKGTKKEPKKEVQKEKIEWRQQKCTLSSFWRVVDAHKERIPEETKKILRGTDFGERIEPFWEDKITENQLIKHEADLEVIMRHFDSKDSKWKFGDVVMEIIEADIIALFHIPAEGEVFNVNRRVVREEVEVSPIFGSPLKKQAVLRSDVETKLITELKKPAKLKDAQKLAVLMITYLFGTFFFTRTGAQITWDMVAVYEGIETINKYNWPRLILDFLMEGLQKYRRNSHATMNGCLLLIYYWFLEKTKAKTWIPGKETETPRFLRWSIKAIFNLELLFKNQNLAVDLIKAGPWTADTAMGDIELDDEVQDTPSFDNWVPQASQAEEEQNKKLTGNIKEIINEMGAAIGGTNPTKEMEEQLERLAKANEDLNAQNRDLWAKLKLADEKITGLEVEKRAKNNHIRALYIRLGKEKGEVPPQQRQLEVVAFTPRVAQEEVEEETPNFGASLGEETIYVATVGHKTERVIEACPLSMELPNQRQGGQQEEEAHLDMVVNMIAENEENTVIGKKKEEKGAPGKQKEKKNMQIMSIERNVKTYKRGAKKAKEDDWEYETPEEAKMRKRTPPKRARIVPPNRKVENKIKIKGVNCAKHTWKTLDPAIGKHFQEFFNATAKDTTEYWISSDLLRRITKHDLRVIIQEGDMETDAISIYIDLLKSDAGKLKVKVGFLGIDAAYYAINHELKKEADEDTRQFECGVETMLIEPLWSIFHFPKVLVPIHHSTSMHYSLLVIDNERRCFTHMNSLKPPIIEFTHEEKYHLNASKVVRHIKRFIHAVNLTKIRIPGDSQDPEVTREKCKGEDDTENLILVEEKMTDEEKETRNWILQNNIVDTTYELYEDFECPQQNTTSADCGPFMLHFMDSIVNGHEPTKEGGDNMRKRILERFMHLQFGRK